MNKVLNVSILVCVLFFVSVFLFTYSHLNFFRKLFLFQNRILNSFQVHANEGVATQDNSEKKQSDASGEVEGLDKESFTNKEDSTVEVSADDLEKFFKQDDSRMPYSDKVIFKALSQRYKNILNIEEKVREKESKLQVLTEHFKDQVKIFDNIKQEITSLLQEYQNVYDEEVLALVKIYEAMKPVEAAQVFSYMDTNLFTKIAMNMKEVKLSAILAKMQPEKVNTLTNALLEARKLSGININYVCNVVFGL